MQRPELFRVKEVAEMLGCNQTRILGFIQMGKLRAINLNPTGRGTWRIDRKDFEAFLESLKTPGPAPAKSRRSKSDVKTFV